LLHDRDELVADGVAAQDVVRSHARLPQVGHLAPDDPSGVDFMNQFRP
jgi:hypothetical protein